MRLFRSLPHLFFLKCSCRVPGWWVSDLPDMSGVSPLHALGCLAYVLFATAFALDQVNHIWCVTVCSTVCVVGSTGDVASDQ